MGSPVYQYNGVLRNGAGGSVFGNLLAGEGFDGTTGKARTLFLDRSEVVSANLAAVSFAEQYTLDSTVAESSHAIYSVVPAAAGAVQKVGFNTLLSTGATGDAIAGSNAVVTTTAHASGNVYGTQGAATVVAASDATARALQGVIINSGTAVTSLAALSKIGLTLVSAGTVKNSAFLYAAGGASGAIGAINCTHGICVDGASCDTSTFAVTSGTTPTILWGTNAGGKELVGGANLASPGAGGGPFAGAAAANITISLTGLTTAADAASASIVVNTTAVTASSRIYWSIISYAGTYATNGVPFVALGAIVAATSFAFQIINIGTAALSGAIGIAFKIEN